MTQPTRSSTVHRAGRTALGSLTFPIPFAPPPTAGPFCARRNWWRRTEVRRSRHGIISVPSKGGNAGQNSVSSRSRYFCVYFSALPHYTCVTEPGFTPQCRCRPPPRYGRNLPNTAGASRTTRKTLRAESIYSKLPNVTRRLHGAPQPRKQTIRTDALFLVRSARRQRSAAFRSRTPGPPPFSSMNSTPAASRAARMAALVEA